MAKKDKKQWKDLKLKEKIIGVGAIVFIGLAIIMGATGAFDETDEEKAEREERQEQREKESAEKKAAKEQKKADEEKSKKEAEKKEEKQESESESEEKEVNASEKEKELTQDEEIKKKITELVEDESGVKINKIDVVENHSDDADGGYNALIHLVFDVQNRAKTAKGAIDADTDRLGSKLAGTEKLENVTFFWEVPYLLEGNNIVKINAKQEDGNMYRIDEWYDGRIFD